MDRQTDGQSDSKIPPVFIPGGGHSNKLLLLQQSRNAEANITDTVMSRITYIVVPRLKPEVSLSTNPYFDTILKQFTCVAVGTLSSVTEHTDFSSSVICFGDGIKTFVILSQQNKRASKLPTLKPYAQS